MKTIARIERNHCAASAASPGVAIGTNGAARNFVLNNTAAGFGGSAFLLGASTLTSGNLSQ